MPINARFKATEIITRGNYSAGKQFMSLDVKEMKLLT